MRASPTALASPGIRTGEQRPAAAPSDRLGGTWSCSITASGDASRTIATGRLDLLHAGSYLVGSGWTDGVPLGRPRLVGDPAVHSRVFEGSVFGAARDEEIVFWISNRLGTALWVLRGRLDGSGDAVVGTATYTDADHASDPPYEASFTLRRS